MFILVSPWDFKQPPSKAALMVFRDFVEHLPLEDFFFMFVVNGGEFVREILARRRNVAISLPKKGITAFSYY